MKNKSKILSLIACLSLLSSCHKNPSSSSSINNSSPTSVNPIPDKINPFDYVVTKIATISDGYNDPELTGKIIIEGFSSSLTDEMKLKIEEVNIPEKINGIDVVSINSDSSSMLFDGFDNLKKITFPKTIITIESNPLSNLSSLEEVIFDSQNRYFYVQGNCLIKRIWNYSGDDVFTKVFSNEEDAIAGWKNVEIPESVTYIDFRKSSSITSIKLNSKDEIIDIDSLRYLDKLSNIDLNGNTNYKLNGNVLYDDTYIYVGYKDVIIPSEITALDSNKNLKNCASITTIKIPNELKSFKTSVFNGLKNLTNVLIDSTRSDYLIKEGSNLLYSYQTNNIICAWGDVTIPNVISVVNLANFESVTSVKLHDGVKKLSNYAFSTTKIKSLTLPSSITDLNSSCFQGMKYLEEIIVNNNPILAVENNILYRLTDGKKSTILVAYLDAIISEDISSIIDQSFEYMFSLKSLTITKNVTSISDQAFLNLNKYRKVKDYVELKVSNDTTLFEVDNNCILQIDKNKNTKTLIHAFINENKEIVFPSSTTDCNLDGLNFDNDVNNIKSIKFNEGLKTIISKKASLHTSLITSINLPSTIENISYYNSIDGKEGYSPFTYFKKLNNITITGGENSFFKIENNCLIKKGSEEKIIFAYSNAVIPDRITRLDDGIFMFNQAITSLTLHNKITYLASDTFKEMDCKVINYKGTLDELKATLTSGNSLLEVLKNSIKNGIVNLIDENGNIKETYNLSNL